MEGKIQRMIENAKKLQGYSQLAMDDILSSHSGNDLFNAVHDYWNGLLNQIADRNLEKLIGDDPYGVDSPEGRTFFNKIEKGEIEV